MDEDRPLQDPAEEEEEDYRIWIALMGIWWGIVLILSYVFLYFDKYWIQGIFGVTSKVPCLVALFQLFRLKHSVDVRRRLMQIYFWFGFILGLIGDFTKLIYNFTW